MNNVDDGIEIWGGTVDLNMFPFGMSVTIRSTLTRLERSGVVWSDCARYSRNASQGSGLGDNIFEFDGAENSDAQPRTRATIYNFTTIANTEVW